MIRFFDKENSTCCYKVRLFLSMLSVRYENGNTGATAPYPAASGSVVAPLERQPVVEDGALKLHNGEAALTYLARKYDKFGTWLPDDARATGLIAQWLSFSSGELTKLDADTSMSACLSLRFLNNHLANRKWLELGRPTIADVSCFPAVAFAHAAGLDLAPLPFVLEWVERFRSIPGFVTTTGI